MKDIKLNDNLKGLPNLSGVSSTSKEEPKAEEFTKHLNEEVAKEKEKPLKKEKTKRKKEEKDEGDKGVIVGDGQGEEDLSHMLLYRIPYVDPSTLSISLRQSLHLEKLLMGKHIKPKELSMPMKAPTHKDLQIHHRPKENNRLEVKGDPFAVFKSIDTSLKEISKQERVKESKIISQIVKNLNVKALKEGHEVRIALSPGVLGETAIQILVEGNTVRALIRTTSKVAYDELRSSEAELKEMLSRKGLKVSSIRVIMVDSLDESEADKGQKG